MSNRIVAAAAAVFALVATADAQSTYSSNQQNGYFMAPGFSVSASVTVPSTSYSGWRIRLYAPNGAILGSDVYVSSGSTGTRSYTVPSTGPSGTYQVYVTNWYGTGGYEYRVTLSGSRRIYQNQFYSYRLGPGMTIRATATPVSSSTCDVRLTTGMYNTLLVESANPGNQADSIYYTVRGSLTDYHTVNFANVYGYADVQIGISTGPAAPSPPPILGEQSLPYFLVGGQTLLAVVSPHPNAWWSVRLRTPSGMIYSGTGGSTGQASALQYTVPLGADGTYTVEFRINSGTYAYWWGVWISNTVPPFATQAGTGAVNETRDQEWNYHHALAAGQTLSVQLSLSANSDWRVTVYSPTNQVVMSRDWGGVGVTESLAYTAPSAGTYRVQVHLASGWGTHTYSGSLSGGSSPPPPATSPTSISVGQSLTNQIFEWQSAYSNRPDGDYGRYSVVLSGGTSYVISTSNAVGASGDTYLYLYSGSTLIASDDQSGGSNLARISYTPTAGATYIVKLRAYAQGTSGTCTLSVQAGSTTPPPTTSSSAVPISVGQSLSGQVFEWKSTYTNRFDGDYGTYSVVLSAGVSYVISTSSAVGAGGDTYLYLFQGTTMLKYDDDGGGNLLSRISFTPAAGGTYAIKLRSYSKGVSGTCTLTVQ